MYDDFAVRQKNKTRPIDDFRENTLNETFGSAEKLELRTMDHVLWDSYGRPGAIPDFS